MRTLASMRPGDLAACGPFLWSKNPNSKLLGQIECVSLDWWFDNEAAVSHVPSTQTTTN